MEPLDSPGASSGASEAPEVPQAPETPGVRSRIVFEAPQPAEAPELAEVPEVPQASGFRRVQCFQRFGVVRLRAGEAGVIVVGGGCMDSRR